MWNHRQTLGSVGERTITMQKLLAETILMKFIIRISGAIAIVCSAPLTALIQGITGVVPATGGELGSLFFKEVT